jgi:hypothetical protein
MGLITKPRNIGSFVTIGGSIAHLVQGSNLVAGESIEIGEACYIKNADGKVYRSYATDGTTEADRVRFFAMDDFDAGQQFAGIEGPITLGYSDGTAPVGKDVYLAVPTSISVPPLPVDYGLGYITPENITIPPGNNITVTVYGRVTDTPVYPGQQALGYILPGGKRLRLYATGPNTPNGTVPAQVTNFAAANGAGSSVLTWDAIAGAIGYLIEESANGTTGWTTVKQFATNGGTVTLTAGTPYLRCTAYGPAGYGTPSANAHPTIS